MWQNEGHTTSKIMKVIRCHNLIQTITTLKYYIFWLNHHKVTINALTAGPATVLQKQLPEVLYKKGILKNAAKFTCASLFFIKGGLRLY